VEPVKKGVVLGQTPSVIAFDRMLGLSDPVSSMLPVAAGIFVALKTVISLHW
jgi:hypothetical protein